MNSQDIVRKVTLGEICSFLRGQTITSKNAVDEGIPVVAGGLQPSYYHNISNRDANTIAVAGSGAYAGYVSYWDKPIYLSDAFSVETGNNVVKKYVYYFLKLNQEKIYSFQKGAGIPHVHGSDIKNLLINIPDVTTQEEIVKILDSFTNLIDALYEELSLRQKQFEYYREKLLTFDDNTNRYCLKEVFETKNGYTPSTSNKEYWDKGNIPWFRMEDIRQNGRILNDSTLHITRAGVKGNRLFKANSIILATSATIGEHALILVEHLSNQRFTNFYPNEDFDKKINMKYIYYYMFIIDEWCKSHVNQGGFASVDMDGLFKLSIPIPSLAVQQSIVSKLDAFESLISSLKEEIALRQKQYEYYREKLLTFD